MEFNFDLSEFGCRNVSKTTIMYTSLFWTSWTCTGRSIKASMRFTMRWDFIVPFSFLSNVAIFLYDHYVLLVVDIVLHLFAGCSTFQSTSRFAWRVHKIFAGCFSSPCFIRPATFSSLRREELCCGHNAADTHRQGNLFA